MQDWPAEWFDGIDSTNEEARRRVKSGAFSDVWIAARSQSAGRGRLGRAWKSPQGNLFSTALFRMDDTIANATKIPFVSGLAVADVVRVFAPDVAVKLKWPNDVRVEGAKLSGILVEAGQLDSGCWVACGIGMNVQTAPDGTGQAATCLGDLSGNSAISTDIVLDALRGSFQKRLQQLGLGFEHIRRDWLEFAEGLGDTIAVRIADDEVSGVFEDLGANGEILLRLPNGSLRSITAGDVELIKERVD